MPYHALEAPYQSHAEKSRVTDMHLPQVSDATLMESLQNLQAYVVVILRKGPRFPAGALEPDSDAMRTIWSHGKRNFALRVAGIMPIVCPVNDGSEICGVGIFARSLDSVEHIMRADPGVTAGLFTYELHATRTVPGSSLPAHELS
jgi:hypothetical protein